MKNKSEKILLPITKWQIGVLLLSAPTIFVATAVFETQLGHLSVWFFIGSFLLFMPAYIILFLDIANRQITHLWSVAMLTIPIIAPFVYLYMRDELKATEPELI